MEKFIPKHSFKAMIVDVVSALQPSDLLAPKLTAALANIPHFQLIAYNIQP